MNKIKIEKGIPLPTITRSKGSKYPFAAMEVGDSCFVPLLTKHIGARLDYFRKKFPERKYVSRTVNGGCRVWRTK